MFNVDLSLCQYVRLFVCHISMFHHVSSSRGVINIMRQLDVSAKRRRPSIQSYKNENIIPQYSKDIIVTFRICKVLLLWGHGKIWNFFWRKSFSEQDIFFSLKCVVASAQFAWCSRPVYAVKSRLAAVYWI